MASRKRYTSAVALKQLDLSDDEHFDENDSDRESDIERDDVDVYSDLDSETTETCDPSVADARNDSSETDSKSGIADPVISSDHTPSTPVFTPRVWECVDVNYTQKVDFEYGHTDHKPSGVSAPVCTPRVWERVDVNYTPKVDFEYGHTAGLNSSINLTDKSHPIDFFNLFLTEEVLSLMVNETNRFADQFMQKSSLKPKARAHDWHPMTIVEMKKFLGLVFLMGYVKKPAIQDYWSTNPTIATPLFNQTMTRDRFELILKFWHYCNNEELPENDRLFKLRGICNMLIARFQAVYTLERDISIDESMVLWRGRLTFRQYIPGKRHKYGVKLYLLCEPSGYVYNLLVYCGKLDAMSGFGHAETVVLKLMDNILGRGHVLYTDNFYTSVRLAHQLLNRQTYLCGTVRKNQKHLPEAVVSAELRKSDIVARKSGQIVVSKWKDKRDVLMLSTLHAGKIVEGSKRNMHGQCIRKPDCVLDYNTRMCGVDRLDQLLSYYSPLRKTLKWYRKVVLQLLDMALSNAFLLYRKCGGNRRHAWFRTQIISSLLNTQDRPAEVLVSPKAFHHNKASDLSRLSGQHYINVLPPTERKQSPTTRCVVCNKRGYRKETRYCCLTCTSKPALCLIPCFQVYHSKADF